MNVEDLIPLVRRVPYIAPDQGRVLYKHIRETHPEHCLELGFAHGVSSCYIAAALAENGSGRLTTVDLEETANHFHPSIDELLEKTGLARWVDVRREHTSYTWFLKKMIEQRTTGSVCQPLYDFCFIDGCKNWTVDGLAFFLVDKLLREGGYILFDDLKWTYEQAQEKYGLKMTDGIVLRDLGDDERSQPHIDLIFRLLVMQHPSYSWFRLEDDNWAWARKVRSDQATLIIDTRLSMRTVIYRLAWPIRKLIGYGK